MPIPEHCIECDKVAVVLDDSVPYCVNCYKKETFENLRYREGHLSKRKTEG